MLDAFYRFEILTVRFSILFMNNGTGFSEVCNFRIYALIPNYGQIRP